MYSIQTDTWYDGWAIGINIFIDFWTTKCTFLFKWLRHCEETDAMNEKTHQDGLTNAMQRDKPTDRRDATDRPIDWRREPRVESRARDLKMRDKTMNVTPFLNQQSEFMLTPLNLPYHIHYSCTCEPS